MVELDWENGKLILDVLCVTTPILLFISPLSLYWPVFRDRWHSGQWPKDMRAEKRPESASAPPTEEARADSSLPHGDELQTIGATIGAGHAEQHVNLFSYPLERPGEAGTDKCVAGTDLPPLAVTSMFLCTVLWMTFGFGIGEPVVWASNILGALLGFFYVVLYPWIKDRSTLSLRHLREYMIQTCISLLLIFVVFALVLALRHERRAFEDIFIPTLGWVSCCIEIPMNSHAIVVIYQVWFKNHPIDLLGSLSMNCFTLLCCSVWVIQCLLFLLEDGKQIILPNALGILSNVLALYVRLVVRTGETAEGNAI
ncbi:hypothetical protein CYMTET_12762 [Cymbomonas tetramitiformis]|uniref:Bidirectional sugar transporter SWEET n=1 Tax=Cymbomonas tetramitiformis TaxID=36881 RepID=A0AAE0LC44_9CHLO|nr:hypothetical protein CYMTET_12762 [Cymbomonas tetramitiformis]|eukprot:gene6029-7246_t